MHLCRCRCRLLVLLLWLWAPIGVVDARLSSSSSSNPQAETRRQKSVVHNEREVALAVELLRSIGVQQICVPDTHTARRYKLTLCISSTTNQEEEEEQRRSLSMTFVDDDFYRYGDDAYLNEREQAAEDARDLKIERIRNSVLALLCIVIVGVTSGLVMGVMSIDPLLLQVKIRAGATAKERQCAASLLPLVRERHRLLVTLLLVNALCYECLPIFLSEIVPSVVAVILSVMSVLFFGEIVPSALFAGPNQISFTSFAVPALQVLMVILFPLAYPVAKLLDWLVSHDEDSLGYNRGELSALVRIQYEQREAARRRKEQQLNEIVMYQSPTLSCEVMDGIVSTGSMSCEVMDGIKSTGSMLIEAATFDSGGGAAEAAEKEQNEMASQQELQQSPGHNKRDASFHFDEVSMVEGALQMKLKCVMDIYTKMRNVFAIPLDFVLDEDGVVKIFAQGYSRIPVYIPNKSDESDCNAICGVLMTKQLIVVDTGDRRLVSTMPLQRPACVSPETDLVEMINVLQGTAERGGHMALVCARPDLAKEALAAGQSVPEDAGLMGIVTLEDVLEVLLQEKVYDEMNRPKRKAARLAKLVTTRWRAFVKKKKQTRKKEAAQQDALKNTNHSRSGSNAAVSADGTAAWHYMLCLD